MFAGCAPDRFDEARRAWIARHAGIFTIQKRRAEILNRQIRDRARQAAGARPNPHEDTVTHPLTARRADTVDGAVELAVVGVALLLAPLGWLLGHLLYRWIVTLIPERLRAYPVPAPLWTAVGIGVLTAALYQPGDEVATALLAPWLLAQIPATFLAAGLYGILNGWLAVDGSLDWWPLAPPPPPVDLDIPLGPDDLTAPGVFAHLDPQPAGGWAPPRAAPSPQRRPSAAPTVVALALCSTGIAWTLSMTALGTARVVEESVEGHLAIATGLRTSAGIAQAGGT